MIKRQPKLITDKQLQKIKELAGKLQRNPEDFACVASLYRTTSHTSLTSSEAIKAIELLNQEISRNNG